MSDLLRIGVGVLCGLGMGLLFFGGLWMTVRRLPTSNRPMLVMLGSFALRTAVLGVCFYGLAELGGWMAVLSGLGGMLLMRMLLIGRFREGARHDPVSVGDV